MMGPRGRFSRWLIGCRLRLAAWIVGRHILLCNAIINKDGAAVTFPPGSQGLAIGGEYYAANYKSSAILGNDRG